jgi:hypothetical protein
MGDFDSPVAPAQPATRRRPTPGDYLTAQTVPMGPGWSPGHRRDSLVAIDVRADALLSRVWPTIRPLSRQRRVGLSAKRDSIG